MPKRSKPISQPSLFELYRTAEVVPQTNLEPERLFNDPHLMLGTSAFTASGWSGSFYPAGMKPTDYLSYYASKFKTVEIDSTYYGAPARSTVENWYRKTPPDFIFAAKVPQVVTHEKLLVDCEGEFDEFVQQMKLLREKLGPLLFQFPHFNKFEFNGPGEFLRRLRLFLKRTTEMFRLELVVEIRNPSWLTTDCLDALREYRVALALTDTSFMPRPWELKKPLDLITSDFTYVRWLGNRKEIEMRTMTWDKSIIDRADDLKHWVELCRQFVERRKIKRLFLFGNNHYQGHGPDTVKTFWKLWKD
jgi:uncharacterized protein YecE (DUF72 family)